MPTPFASPEPAVGHQSVSLQAALYGALTGNPDLVALREGNPAAASAEAVEVARRFPTTLNPTLWIDYRPISLIPRETFGTGAGGGSSSKNGSFYHNGGNYLYLSLRQPVELGHQTTHRYHIAKAAYDSLQWTVLQAELTALVQTYRFFQTAAYNRERTRVAEELASFNDKLLESLQRRLEANQVTAADVALARVESRAARQLVKAARQTYVVALTDLRNQIGVPETAGTVEPLGEFTLPTYVPEVDEQLMIQTALQNRPDIHAARAFARGADASVRLAKADRIPTPVIGPEWEIDEVGVQYVGLVFISPLPIVNNGTPLVKQREAEHRRAHVALQQVQQRAVSQVRASVAKWNGARELVNDSAGLIDELAQEVSVLERLFQAGQSDLTKLMQARQRLIQLQNAQLDAVWQATQAQADLLLAIGTPTMIRGMLAQAQRDATPGPDSAVPPIFETAPPPPN
ncbi:MAG: TolC family protein [Paludisphaera borealis]|uniref:TolC family protein n=1 Tax=Paludisphaera borealis TaxID=1387353 RepID=UPI002847A56C|nr:TolC family protein [Paludisphaera borealis]MDR3620227.1 TolC family protein [Paludisphaera borealis]